METQAPRTSASSPGEPTSDDLEPIQEEPIRVFQSVQSQLNELLKKRVLGGSLTLPRVPLEVYDQLRELDDYSSIKFDYDYSSELLSIQFTLFPHVITPDIIFKAVEQVASDLPSIKHQAGAGCELKDKTNKTPDLSFFDPTIAGTNPSADPAEAAQSDSTPRVVWEVAVSETPRKMHHDLARWSTATDGEVALAIGVCVTYSDSGSLRSEERKRRTLKRVVLSEWCVKEYINEDKSVAKKDCGVVRKADGEEVDEDEETPPRYAFSVWREDLGVASTWIAGSESVEIFGPNQQSGYICLKVGHIFREIPDGYDYGSLYARIPYSKVVEALLEGDLRQKAADARMKKRPTRKGDSKAEAERLNKKMKIMLEKVNATSSLVNKGPALVYPCQKLVYYQDSEDDEDDSRAPAGGNED